MLRRMLFILAVGAAFVFGCDCTNGLEEHDLILLGTGPEDGSYDRFGSQLLNHLRRNTLITGDTDLLQLDVRNTTGAGNNLALLQEGEITFGIIQEDLIPDFSEMQPSETGKIPEIRIVAPLYREAITLVLSADLNYAPGNLASLDGRRFAIGPRGSGTEHNALQVLKFLQMRNSLTKIRPFASLKDAIAQFDSNEIDGFFLTLGHPNAALRDSFKKLNRQAHLVDLPPEAFPIGSYVPWTIGHEVYPEVIPARGVRTMATRAMLCARSDSSSASEQFIYALVRNLYLDVDRMVRSDPLLHSMEPKGLFTRFIDSNCLADPRWHRATQRYVRDGQMWDRLIPSSEQGDESYFQGKCSAIEEKLTR